MPSQEGDTRPETSLNVDHALVAVIEEVEQAVGTYLAERSQANLDSLRDTLARLDDQTAASDHWAQSIASSAGLWGYGDTHVAIGQTGNTPLIDQETPTLFNARVAMVQAAKAVIRRPEPNSVEVLRQAFAAVADWAG